MEFSDTQKDVIKQWVGEGCNLAEIQRRIASEFGKTMTYMDVRFLIVDLDVAIEEPEEKAPEVDDSTATATPASPEPPPPAPGDSLGGSVTVEIDRLMRPGALVSGSVVFSDGVTATWMLDQQGRLGIDPSQPGYRPSDADNEAFVQTLQAEIEKRGMR
ncbi:MAG: hypothetical protein HN341_01115 [Verrucomicrobia bacterium]|jgi:hypothetical protein|nr:hypothetical protein [Verrucomicrobiota bacterium]